MNNELWQKAEEIAAKKYAVIVTEDKDSTGQPIFLAKTPELYGCMAQGSSPQDAKANLKDARIDYIYSLLEDNLKIPEPTQVIFSTVKTSSNLDENEFTLTRTITFGKRANEIKPLYAESLTN